MEPFQRWSTPVAEVLVFRTIEAFKEACANAQVPRRTGDTFVERNPERAFNNSDCECCQNLKQYAIEQSYNLIVKTNKYDNERHFIGLMQRNPLYT